MYILVLHFISVIMAFLINTIKNSISRIKIRYILDDIDKFINEYNETYLFKYCLDGNLTIVKYLIEHNANIHLINSDGENCLFNACRSKNIKLVKYLIEKGIDINKLDDHNRSCLFIACAIGCLELVKCLLNNGSDITIKDLKFETCLFNACIVGNLEIIKFLIDKRIDVNQVNVHGLNCLFLLNKKCKNNLEIVKLLHAAGLNMHHTNTLNKSYLFFATENLFAHTVLYLLKDCGLNPNIKSALDGNTPLMELCNMHYLSYTNNSNIYVSGIVVKIRTMIRLFLRYGADPFEKNFFDKSPVDYAMNCDDEKLMAIFRIKPTMIYHKNKEYDTIFYLKNITFKKKHMHKDICSICHEPSNIQSSCNHNYCKACYSYWYFVLDKPFKCACCRTPLENYIYV